MQLKIEQLERHTETGIVFTAHWRASIQDGSYYATIYGSVQLPEPEGNIIPYEELTEEIVLGWLTGILGEEFVSSMEATLLAQIETQKNPPTASGLPWAQG